MSGLGFVSAEPEQYCEMCGVIAECRPYGINGEQICYDCGQTLDPEQVLRRMHYYLFGEPLDQDSE